MNWRQGLFRVWATLSLAWVVLIAIYAYSKLPDAYQEFQRAQDASTIKVISPTYADVYEVVEALEVIEALKVDIPQCRDGDKSQPEGRQSRGTLPGTMVDAAGSVVGPFSAFDHATALAEWVEASQSRANFLAWVGFAPPILLGTLILALGWVSARFDRNKPRTEA